MKKNCHQLCFVKLILFLSIVIMSTPIISGNNIHIKTIKNQITEHNHYFFDKLYCNSTSEPNNLNNFSEINNLNIKQEVKNNPVFDIILSINVSSGLMDSCWPMKCHDPHHTGRSPYSTIDNPGGEKWRFQTEGRMESGMVIDKDGMIYFGELHDYLYAVYPDGSLKWKYNIDDWIWSTPAIAEDGTVYIGSLDARLYAINPDGSLKWKFAPGGSIYSSPAIRDDGVIVFGTAKGFDKGDIIALYPNGTLYWRYQTDDYVFSDPAIGDDGTVYIGSCDSYLYAINPDGTLKWRFKTGDWVKSHPSIADDGTIYFSSFDLNLYALNPDGSLKWKHGGCYGGCSSTVLGNDGTIYVAGEKSLLAINPDGTNKWSCPIGSDIGHSSPVIDADGIIYTGAGGKIIAVNPDGTERWSKKIGNYGVYSSPCIGEDGTVYIGSSCIDRWRNTFGFVHAFTPQEYNHSPDTPEIWGKVKWGVNTEIFIIVGCNDPENNPLSFYVDWGDGTYTDWEYGVPSDGLYYFEHIYSSMGTYAVRVKARDDFGGESNWGIRIITVSKNKAINTSLFLQKLIQHFPFFEKILN